MVSGAMNVTEETSLVPATAEITLAPPADRRSDIDAKHQRLTANLRDVGADGLLVLRPENFGWLTSGSPPRGVLDRAARPALYFSLEGRWLLCSNAETQRLFDEEIDGLGFQLKEWPWHWGRGQLLSDLTQGRNIAVDEPYEQCQSIGDTLAQLRRPLSPYEAACYRAVGRIVAHSLEA